MRSIDQNADVVEDYLLCDRDISADKRCFRLWLQTFELEFLLNVYLIR